MKRLMVGSAVLIVIGIGAIASDAFVGQSRAEVTGRLMSSAELQQTVGAEIGKNGCRRIGTCGLSNCQFAGAACSYCDAQGADSYCVDNNPKCVDTVTPDGCGSRWQSTCSSSLKCSGGTKGQDCARQQC